MEVSLYVSGYAGEVSFQQGSSETPPGGVSTLLLYQTVPAYPQGNEVSQKLLCGGSLQIHPVQTQQLPHLDQLLGPENLQVTVHCIVTTHSYAYGEEESSQILSFSPGGK